MKSKKIENTYILRLEKGEEIIQTLTKFCIEQKISGGSLSGIGGIQDVCISYYDIKSKKYVPKNYSEEVYEMISLLGNISLVDNTPFAHLHITIAGSDHQVLGGHLSSATVAVTCEIFLHITNAPLYRKTDEEFGLKFLEM